MQELSLKSGGGRNFGRGRNPGRVRYMLVQTFTSVMMSLLQNWVRGKLSI